ncbi:hypothetical protein QT327_00440 [Olivibacter sp. 47]|uniref:hypothetical protein n=1 Tax=Olivibacter sp. 47 TaxID=3056486 RepID=UPI0025A3C209|nr:hypothetical protein [Olivibacter sp. 47]MDM8172826.1 hypothetical protein [Olivibacter sp. 47]
MRKVLVYVMSILMLLQTGSALLIMTAFYANRDYIAQNLCENRTRPELHCNGQCVLMKKLKKEQEREAKHPELKLKEVQFLLAEQTFLPPLASQLLPIRRGFDLYKLVYTFKYHRHLLRPPIS